MKRAPAKKIPSHRKYVVFAKSGIGALRKLQNGY